jgi:hypothetical protein
MPKTLLTEEKPAMYLIFFWIYLRLPSLRRRAADADQEPAADA